MATLILRTSCEPPNDDDDAVDRRRHFVGGASSSPPSSSSSAVDDRWYRRHRDVEGFVASRPLQCDVSLVPRIPAGEDRGENNGRDGRRGDAVPAALRFAGIALNPCGTSSVIVIDRLPPSSPPPVVVVDGGGDRRRAKDGGVEYLISLARCTVSVPDDYYDYDYDDYEGAGGAGGSSSPSSLLPVTASPSTFRVSFADGGDHFLFHPPAVGEVRVSFDYAVAVGDYRDMVVRRRRGRGRGAGGSRRGRGDDDDDDACGRIPIDDAVNDDEIVSGKRRHRAWRIVRNESSHRSFSSCATSPIARDGGDLSSIARSLERESLFVRRSLLVLGCTGVVLVAALVRAMRGMARTRGGARRRRAAAVVVVVGGGNRRSVPLEIGGTVEERKLRSARDDEEAGDDEDDREGGSIPSPERGGLHDGRVSPLRPSSVATIAEGSGNDDDIARMHVPSSDAENDDSASPETADSTPPFAPPIPAVWIREQEEEQEQNRDGGKHKAPTESLRHWYEDYLSPPKKATRPQDPDQRNNDDAAFAEEGDDISRSLFTPVTSSVKVFGEGPDANNGIASIVRGYAPREAYRLPGELDFDTPMRSAHSPPPNNVSLMRLSRHIETAFADDDSDVLSQNSGYSTNASFTADTLAKRPRVVSPDVSCIVDGDAGRLNTDSFDDVVDDDSEAPSRKSIEATNASSTAGNLANGSIVVSPDVSCIIDGAKEDDAGDAGGLDSSSCGDVTASIENDRNRGSPGSRGEPEVSSIVRCLPNASKSELCVSIWRDTSSGDVTRTGAPTNLSSDVDIVKNSASKSTYITSPERSTGTALSQNFSHRETGVASSPSKFVYNFNCGESPCLELKLGYPVNTSYDSTELNAANIRGQDSDNHDARIFNDKNLSIEVEKDSSNAKYGELLVIEEGKHDEIDVPAVGTAVSRQLLSRLNVRIDSFGEKPDKSESSLFAATVDTDGDDSGDNLALEIDETPNPTNIHAQAEMMFHKVVEDKVDANLAQESNVITDMAAVNVASAAVASGQIQVDNMSREIDKKMRGGVKTKGDRFPIGFLEELVERATGLKAPHKTAKRSDFSSMVARRALEVARQLPSSFAAKSDDFASSLAKRVLEAETWRASPDRAHARGGTQVAQSRTKTPKSKLLTPLPSCQSSRSTPGSSHTGEATEDFLSDYW